ncbi:protein NRT1/ PTR FAMILY 1.2 [Manihot esculenta]|nr:protein NRT1/ PTR FAMILY 1.2 [Manihot esculenta]
MVFYLTKEYHMSVTQATTTIFLWNAATNFTPLLGALISDSYLGRFLTIGIGSTFSLLGTILMWLTAMIPFLRPLQCNQMTQEICENPTTLQMAILVISMGLVSIGAGGIRPCSLAFGADQLVKRSDSKNKGLLESYFGWYYACTAIAVLLSMTVVVYIQERYGWKVGYAVPAILMFLSVFLFFVASPLYFKQKERTNLLTGFAQVLVAAYKNRKVPFPPKDAYNKYYHKKNSESSVPTENLRFLNKACIITNPEQDLASDGSEPNSWSLCTVERVEELKVIIRVIPIWSTGIMISINVSQGSLQVFQAISMDRHLTPNFEIPAGTFAMFLIISVIAWIVLYDRVIIPLASKIKGEPVRLDVKLRMGIGIFFSCMAMVVAGIVENIRRRKAIMEGHLNNPQAVVQMSALWLIPQFCFHGLAEAFNSIAQSEFFYSEFPKSLSSIAGALSGLGSSVANLLATVILSVVNQSTSKGGKDGWVPDNINKGRYDKYYGLLAIMSFLNLLYFVFCCWAYGPSKDQSSNFGDDDQEEEE